MSNYKIDRMINAYKDDKKTLSVCVINNLRSKKLVTESIKGDDFIYDYGKMQVVLHISNKKITLKCDSIINSEQIKSISSKIVVKPNNVSFPISKNINSQMVQKLITNHIIN